MTLTTLVIGFFFLDPTALTDLANSARAQSVFLSNVSFLRNTGYFAERAKDWPLLHTWSLAVEEQFYVIFPAVLFGVYRFWKQGLRTVLTFAAILSFLLSVAVIERYSRDASFFLLPTRAWELLAGALIAITRDQFILRRRYAEMLAALGLILLLGPMFLYDDSTSFPGLAALPPVLGATLVIIGATNSATLVGRMLSVKPLVFVGLISYSLYLWHWPLVVFVELTIIELTASTRLLVVAMSFLLATVSWKYVECPIREKESLRKHSTAFAFGSGALLVVLIPAVSIAKLGGVPSRLDEKTRILSEDISWTGSEYDGNGAGVPIGRPGTKHAFALWGDSHGMAIAEMVSARAARSGLSGMAYLDAGTAPVIGLSRVRDTDQQAIDTRRTAEHILQEIVERRITHVILVARWSLMCEGYNSSEIVCDRNAVANPKGAMVTDRDDKDPTPDKSAWLLSTQLRQMLQRLTQRGTTVWIIKQVPEADLDRVARRFYLATKYPMLNKLERESTPYTDHLARQARTNAVLDSMSSAKVHVLDPTPCFFPAPGALELYAERSFYRDDDHLTRYGAEAKLGGMMTSVFERIAHDESDAGVLR